MAWEDCLANLRRSLAPKQVIDMDTVDWSKVDQNALDQNSFAVGNPYFLACQGRHCIEDVNQSPIEHSVCRCRDANNNPIPGCTPPSFLYPLKASVCVNVKTREFNGYSGRRCTRQGDDWYEVACYCCCSCFANGTLIGVPDGFKVIEQFNPGDQVLTADVQPNGKGLGLNWSTTTVSYSSGTGPDGYQPSMVYVRHGGVGTIIVTPDHLFLMPNGKLKRANRLVPGVDFLVSADGVPVEINEVSLGEYKGGVHHIATNKEFAGEISGHLLISEGVVSGDFNLQIHADDLKESHFIEDHDDLPIVGTEAYEQAYAHLVNDKYRTFAAVDNGSETVQVTPKIQKFYVHGQHTVEFPVAVAQYVSDEQSEDIRNNAAKYEFAEVGIGYAVVQYAIKLFGGFYPDITFYHDIGRLEPNAYAFTQYGKKFVVITGGLTRIKGLGLEGLSMIFSHMVSRLQNSAPQDEHGFTSVAMADYYSTGIMRNVFFGNMYTETYDSGIQQIAEFLFNNIEDANDKYAGDPYEPTRELRMDSLDAGNTMHFPPEGTGGPVQYGLKVTGAQASAAQLNAASFVTLDITEEMSEAVFSALQENKLLSETGVLADPVDVETDLSFLFADVEENLRALLIAEVRYILLHASPTVQVSFNLPVSKTSPVDSSVFTIVPKVKISSAAVSEDGLSVIVAAALQKDTAYTLTVSRTAKAANNSTLDPKKNTATFTLE